MPTIPKNAGEITPAWLTDVLQSHGATMATITDVRLEQVGAGVGIMGEIFRVELSYEPGGEGPSSVVVKLPSPYEANRQQGVDLGVYEAEIRFYQNLVDATPVRTPLCYFADIVSGTSEFAMVMEDLSGMIMASQIEGMTLEQTQQAFDALVGLHLAWWGKVKTPELEWVPSVVHARIETLAGIWPDLWAAFASKFGDLLPVGSLEAGEQIAHHYWPLMQHLGRQPWTLLHQDFRVENLFFDPSGGEVVVFDWQSLGRGPGAYDLAYLLGGSMVSEERAANERDLVQEYHRRLVAAGIDGYSYEDLWRDYRIGNMVVTAVPVLVGATMDLANERGTELIATLGRRHFSAVVDLDAAELIPLVVAEG
jgi:hypothetical protein